MLFNSAAKLAVSTFLFASLTSAIDICSTELTGSQSTLEVSIYQSNGLCTTQCSGYAYAILLNKQCWCSNYTPSTSVSVSECDSSCPGYPDDTCGNDKKNLFAYILLSNPSGTSVGSKIASSTTLKSTRTTTKTSSTPTSFTTSRKSESSSFVSSSSDITTTSSFSSASTTSSFSSSSFSSSSFSSSSSSSSATSSTALSTITVVNSAETFTVTRGLTPTTAANTEAAPTATGATLEPTSKSSGNGFFNNKGAVAGVFTVVGLVALALILLVIYLIYRRRRQTDGKDLNQGIISGKGSPNSFVNRSALGGASSVTGLTAGQGRTSPQSAMGLGAVGSENEKGPIYDSHTLVPIEVDQRLDPNKVYMRWENNESTRSLQDDHDYSRKVLRVTNPDDSI